MSLVNTINYNNPSNFTFNNSLITVSGSNAQLANIRPANSTFYAGFFVGINADYGNGSLTGTPTGSVTGTGNLLTLSGGNNYVDYSATGNADSQQVGTLRVDFIPQYNGSPSGDQVMISINQTNGSLVNLMEIYHDTSGGIVVAVFDQTGTRIDNTNYGTFVAVSGTSYEFEFDYDFTNGVERLFINGIQFGPTRNYTLTRSSSIGLLRLGNDGQSPIFTANFNLSNVIIFNTIQHSANFPGEIPRAPETQYSLADPVITVNSSITTNELLAFTENAVKPSNTAIQYQVLVNAQPMYWNGSAWAVSNGTYAQSNPASIINTNATSLVSSASNIKIAALLNSSFGNATPVLTSVTETYNFSEPSPTQPPQCAVFAFLEDIIGNTLVSNAQLNVELPNAVVISGYIVAAFKTSVAFNASGFASIPLVSTNTVSANYNFSVTYVDSFNNQRIINFIAASVPTAVDIALTTLTTIEVT